MQEEIKKLWKPFVVIFLLSFLLLNRGKIDWNPVFLVSNYKFIVHSWQEFFKIDLPEVEGKEDSVKKDLLRIPKIGVEAPLIFAKNTENSELDQALKQGVLLYPGSALPGKPGQTIILGHSAPQGWPRVNYQWIFSDLNKLVEGDEIFVDFNGEQYIYKVQRKFILKPGQEIPDARLTPLEVDNKNSIGQQGEGVKPLTGLTNNESVIILLSCWPPGKNYKRLAVEATLR